MKNNKRIFIIMMIFLIIVSGCSKKNPTNPNGGNGGNPPDPATVSSVVVSPISVSVEKGQSYQFSATVYGNNSPPQTVTWTVIGGIGSTTINSSGYLTISSSETATSLTVRATSTFDTSKYGNAIVGVTTTIQPPTVSSVVVSPSSASVYKGGIDYFQFSATVYGNNNPPQTVTWTVTGGIASFITNGGLYIPTAETASSLTVRATSTLDTNKYGTAYVTVLNTPIISGVVVSPAEVTLARGQSRQFTAVVQGPNNPPQSVIWASSSNYSNITQSGLLTVSAYEASSLIVIGAASTYNSDNMGFSYITVSNPFTTSVSADGSLFQVSLDSRHTNSHNAMLSIEQLRGKVISLIVERNATFYNVITFTSGDVEN